MFTVCDKEREEEFIEGFCCLFGKCLGFLRFRCIVVRKLSSDIPVIMHKFSKYGAQFVLQFLPEKEFKQLCEKKLHKKQEFFTPFQHVHCKNFSKI